MAMRSQQPTQPVVPSGCCGLLASPSAAGELGRRSGASMNRILSAGLMIIVLAPWPVPAVELVCPKAPPSHDWQGFRLESSQIRLLKEDEVPKSLGAVAGVSVFDGSPTEMADLVPDNPDA